MAARVGSLQQAAAQAHTRGAAANQMDVDDGSGAPSRLDRIEAALNALTSGGGHSGMGTRTQTQRGYQQERRGGRGGFHGGRGGRMRGAQETHIPKVPGVPAALVEQRRAAGQCYRCGAADHTRFECANASSASAHSTN